MVNLQSYLLLILVIFAPILATLRDLRRVSMKAGFFQPVEHMVAGRLCAELRGKDPSIEE